MSLNSTSTRLTAHTAQLAVRWGETREHWRDARATEFEKRFLDELFNRVSVAAGSIQDLDRVLTRLRRDCE